MLFTHSSTSQFIDMTLTRCNSSNILLVDMRQSIATIFNYCYDINWWIFVFIILYWIFKAYNSFSMAFDSSLQGSQMSMGTANGRRRYNVFSQWLSVSSYPEWSYAFLNSWSHDPLPLHIHWRKSSSVMSEIVSIHKRRTWWSTWQLNTLQLNRLCNANATLVATVTCMNPNYVDTLKPSTGSARTEIKKISFPLFPVLCYIWSAWNNKTHIPCWSYVGRYDEK